MLKLADITSSYRAKLISDSYRKWIKPNQKVLDIGCGTGVVADELHKILGIKTFGCDIDSYLIRNIPFKKMNSFSKLPYKSKTFKYSTFNDVLHHTDYNNQVKLIKEAGRVSDKILIFELVPTTTGKIADLLINKIHNPNMKIPYTYRQPTEWLKLFKDMRFQVEKKRVRKPLLYPFTHIAFLLSN
jgi:ubiquinone/menaquinone biosynthesis C-methylase UbiE